MLASMYRFLFACSIVVGCGGSPAPKSPEASSEAETASEPAAPKSETASEPAKENQSDAAPAGSADIQAVLQLVIDDEALNPYLHLDRPDRFPLRISGRDLPQDIELSKATKPVLIVPEGEADKKPTVVFTEVKVSGDEASVRYRYDVEKVRGASTLKRRDGQWVLIRSRVSEH
jgi:hypothetical protein